MVIKPGVRVLGIRPEMVLAFVIIESVARRRGWDVRLTSGIEGQHTRASLHYTGNAGDIGLPPQPEAATAELREALGDDFDVVLEKDAPRGPHIHIEFQPKAPY